MLNNFRSSWWYGKAGGLLNKKRYSEAKIAIDKCLLLNPDQYLKDLAYSIKGEIEYNLGNMEEAKTNFIKFKESVENDSDFDGIGKVEEQLKRVNHFLMLINETKT